MLRPKPEAKNRMPGGPASFGVGVAFRWRYILLPIVVLVLSMLLTACFYHRLPAEVAYHFQSDGSPDRWQSRGTIILWLLWPQLFLTLLATGIAWGVPRLGTLFRLPISTPSEPPKVLLLMGNMVALPQILLCFAMADIFSYNAYLIHILPLWTSALIVIGVGTIVLGILFLQAIRQAQGIGR